MMVVIGLFLYFFINSSLELKVNGDKREANSPRYRFGEERSIWWGRRSNDKPKTTTTRAPEVVLKRNCSKPDGRPPLVNLLHFVRIKYLMDCTIVILYGGGYKDTEILAYFLKHSSVHMHGTISNDTNNSDPLLSAEECKNYVIFIENLFITAKAISLKNTGKVVIVTNTSFENIKRFLTDPSSHGLLNLLIVPDYKDSTSKNIDINLYTHQLFTKNSSSSTYHLLTAWRCDRLTRPHINLFPKDKLDNFHGHTFVVAVGHQPPFIFPKTTRVHPMCDSKLPTAWDGQEVRLLTLMANALNFTLIFKQTQELDYENEVASAVVEEVQSGNADIGAAGIYISPKRLQTIIFTTPHSQDCASFITLALTALPKYRAIMGPFHWSVWLAVTLTYLLAIFPLFFSHHFTFSHLIKNPWEMENMFWYVFGTFTNCFTFKGSNSWNKADRNATKMLIGWYWMFSIIITACYTGSIIAFVTLPVFPAVIDNSKQLLEQDYRIGTLDSGGWEYWFDNSSDPFTIELIQKMEYVPSVIDGLHNITRAYYNPYAFLGSRILLLYILMANYTSSNENKRSHFHISAECFVPFHISLVLPLHSTYADKMNGILLQIIQSGMFLKIQQNVQRDLYTKGTGKILQAQGVPSVKTIKSEDQQLSLDDVQGTFLLLGAGFAIGFFALFIECIVYKVKQKCCNIRSS